MITKTTETDINLEEARADESEAALTPVEEETMKNMIDSHVFYGHLKSKTNPKMKPNIVSTKSGVEIIDLVKTMKQLDEAAEFIKSKVKAGGNVLFVGTTPASKAVVKETAERLEMPYVVERWLGGTFTNFKTISDRINHFKKLTEDKEAGRLQKYTKKERLDIDTELAKLDKFFGGIVEMDKLPAVVFISDLGAEETPAKEAKITGIPSVALVNTNCDPEKVTHPISANNRNTQSITLILSRLEKAISEGKSARKAEAEEKRSQSEDRVTDRS